jgi:hypothetical protein
VDEVEVEVVQPQLVEAALERRPNPPGTLIGVPELGSDEQLLTGNARGSDCDPDAVLVAVKRRGVDAAIAGFQGRRHSRPRLVVPHLEDPEAELRHPDAVVERYVRDCA